MIRKSFVYLLASLNHAGDVTCFLKKVVVLLCYSLLVGPLLARADTCTSIDYNITTIASGAYHTVGIKEDGTVVAVGSNYVGQLNVSGWTNIKAIAAGWHHTVGLKNDGTVVAVGANYAGQLNVSSWTNIKAIAAGHLHTVGLQGGWNSRGNRA